MNKNVISALFFAMMISGCGSSKSNQSAVDIMQTLFTSQSIVDICRFGATVMVDHETDLYIAALGDDAAAEFMRVLRKQRPGVPDADLDVDREMHRIVISGIEDGRDQVRRRGCTAIAAHAAARVQQILRDGVAEQRKRTP